MYKTKILNSVNVLFRMLFFFILFQIIIGTKSNYSYLVSVDTWKIFGIFSILFLVCYSFLKLDDRWHKLLFWLLCIIWLFVQVIYVYMTYSQNGSDAYVVNYYAYWNAKREIEDFYYYYLAHYQNNIGLTFILSGIYKILGCFISFLFDQTWVILAVISALFADVAIVFTVLFSQKYLGRKFDCFALMFACTLIGLSEEGTVFYSDIISLWTIPCFFYLVCLSMKQKRRIIRIVEYILMGVVLGIGGWLKPQVLICFIALVCYLIVCEGALKKKVSLFLIVGIALFLTRFSLNSLAIGWYQEGLPNRFNEVNQFMEDNNFPMLHWMNLGMNYETLGTYNVDDVVNTEKIVGYNNKKEYLQNSIKNRLKSHSIMEWLIFMNNKVVYSLQNGSFSAGKAWKEKALNNTTMAQRLQNYLDPADENYFDHVGIIVQCVYCLCLAGMIRTAKSNMKRENGEDIVQYVGEISLIGVILFLVLFERNIRYFYSFIPLVIVFGIKGALAEYYGACQDQYCIRDVS